MSDNHPLHPKAMLEKIKGYSHKAFQLGQRAREFVFGLNPYAMIEKERWSLPIKLNRHRVIQRRRAFNQAGGRNSSLAQYGMNKAITKNSSDLNEANCSNSS